MKNGVKRVNGSSVARLVTILMPPPMLFPGAMPLISAPGPFNNSIRSMIWAGTRCEDVKPYRPLNPTSVAATGKPRI